MTEPVDDYEERKKAILDAMSTYPRTTTVAPFPPTGTISYPTVTTPLAFPPLSIPGTSTGAVTQPPIDKDKILNDKLERIAKALEAIVERFC